jgi:hypothetical protein
MYYTKHVYSEKSNSTEYKSNHYLSLLNKELISLKNVIIFSAIYRVIIKMIINQRILYFSIYRRLYTALFDQFLIHSRMF